jgi:hypothetical protein
MTHLIPPALLGKTNIAVTSRHIFSYRAADFGSLPFDGTPLPEEFYDF